MPAHGLVNLVVFRVLALPLYLYVEPWGRNLEKEHPQSRFSLQGKSPSRTPGPDARVLGVWPQTPGSLASGPWPLQNCLLPEHFGKHLKPLPVNSGTLPGIKHYYPIYQTLSPDHSRVPRHVRDLIRNSEQHSVTNIHNSYNTISSTNVKRADPTGSRTM